jgi:uncharacterized phage protein gp47/JayE
MPFARPTLAELIARNDAEIASRLGIGPLLRRSVLGVLSRMIAGASHMLFGYADWTARQVFPETADAENLARHASLFGLERKPAVAATGFVLFTGAAGSTVGTATRLRRADGALYETTAGAALGLAGSLVPVRAITPGLAGNSPSLTKLALLSPLSGVASPATVQAPGIEDGIEAESDAELLARLLVRARKPPGGGSAADYERWARDVPGVTRAWVQPQRFGVGTVGVAFAVDDDSTGPIPSAGQVAIVQAAIDELRPVTASAIVYAPLALALDPEIEITPDTPEARVDVEASLADLLRREGAPGSTVLVSHLRQAIGSAAGVEDYTLSSPTMDVDVPTGSLPVVGEITWL